MIVLESRAHVDAVTVIKEAGFVDITPDVSTVTHKFFREKWEAVHVQRLEPSGREKKLAGCRGGAGETSSGEPGGSGTVEGAMGMMTA